MNPVVVHVVRPYASEQDYLASEAWSIEARGMLLIDVEPLPEGTPVLFDVTLDDGQKPIRAEGRVVGIAPAQGTRPAGLKVRFRRFGAATKAFIERAVKSRTEETSRELASRSEGERASAVQMDPPSAPAAERPPSNSGVQRRVPGPVAAPAHRDELLARLRERHRAG